MDKEILKSRLQSIIRWLAIWTIKKYQPGIIAVTGSAGKTSTKNAIYTVLKDSRRVRATSANFNNAFGVPLTILGDWKEIAGNFFWVKVLLVSILRLIFPMSYPEVLVLEYGIDRPGDMKYLLDIAKPQIAVITAIGDIPVHVEFFSSPEALAREKSKLIESLPAAGFSILNYDDEIVSGMRERTRSRAITFGFNEGAEMRISNFEQRMEGMRPNGISFKLNYGGNCVPVRLDNCFGKAQSYAVATAACVGLLFGLNLVKISEAIRNYETPPGRGRILDGIKKTFIIDDSYNASPLSMSAALETLHELKAKRKIAVLGDMLEIGEYTTEAHEHIGELVPKRADMLVTVGARAKFIADTAIKKGMPKKNVHSFDTADEAKLPVQELLRQGDLVLVKASHSIGLEKIVEEIKAF